ATATNTFGCTDTAHALVMLSQPSVDAMSNLTTVCANSPFDLSANLLYADFNGVSNNWTAINNSTGGTPANGAWTLRTSPYVYVGTTLNSNDASQFYFTNSDAQGSGGTTHTILRSPAINTTGMTSLSLDFYQYFRAITGDSANVEVSTDGTNWTLAQAFTATVGAPTAFAPSSVSLTSYIGNPSLYVRLRYKAAYGWYWGVDNIKISGNSTNTFAWTSNPVGYTSSTQNPTGVTGMDTTIYTVTVTDANTCTSTSSVTVNIQDQISGNTIGTIQTLCSGSTPAQLTGGVVSGGSGTNTYLWQSSTTNGTTGFSAATGTNSNANYSPSSLTATTWYRRIVASGSCADTSASVEITITPGITNNTISASQNICSGSTPALLIGSTPVGAGGTYTYSWLSSTTNANSGFVAASGTNTAIDYTPSALTTNTWYKRVANSGTCSDTSAAITINVSMPITGNNISASQSICLGGIVAPFTGNITGIYDDLNGITGTGGLTTASLPLGWTMTLNQGNLATGFNTNSYGRPTPNGAIRINNYSVSSGNVARMDTKAFGPSVSGDSLRFDVAYGAYEDGFGPYSDTVRIYTTSGSGYTLLKQYVTGLNIDTSENGVNTAAFSTAAFVPTATQWTRKKLSLPTGTTNVRFEFASGFGNRMYLDRIQVDSAMFTWLSSTTSATSGFTPASGVNTNSGYNPGVVTQTTWYRRVATTGGACAPDTSAAVVINVSSPITGNTISASQTICSGNAPSLLTGTMTGIYDDLDGLTATTGLTTAALPTGWTMALNQGNLATGFNTNSYGRPTPNGAIRSNNYNVGSGNIARIDTKTFGPAKSGDSLRFDVAYAGYDDAFGPYVDTLRIYTTTGSGYTLLKQYTTGLVVDTSDNGITTGNFVTGSFTPTATQWARKKLALPSGTTNVRFELASGFGNSMYIDRIQTDSAMFTWLSSTTSATTGFTTATGNNSGSGYAPGALTQNTWYKRVVNTGGACPSDTSVAIQITVNTGAIITAQPAPTVAVCSTNTIMLNVAATNGLGYQWYNGTTLLSNSGNVSGATSANLRVTNAATTDAGNYTVVVTSAVGCDNDTSNNSTVTVNSLGATLAANNASAVYVHSDGVTNLYTDASCNPILKIQDVTGGNTLGSVATNVVVPTSVQNAPNGQKYLPRYYNVTPTSNGAATVTLYALQSEFTAYNNAPGSYPAMPATGSNSDPNIGNIRVTKYAGSPFVGGGSALLINPSSVTWNSTMNWWEITFPVTTFSSFYIHTGTLGPLAIDIEHISAVNVGSRNRVDWITAHEVNAEKFEVERSLDGKNFEYIGTVMAKGEASNYSLWHELPFEGLNHYRLKMIDKGGRFEYSKTVNAVVRTNGAFVVQAFPNPVSDKLTVRVNGKMSANAYIFLTDMAGKLIMQQEVTDTETVIDMNSVAQGVYFMKYIDDKHSQTIKVNKN
ncbi:MAG TPA: T9SS type A sorting domain-containing protein, partial [Flavipsychrobacter sp.]|nr:T9SS type A sorting domain-containing protein [Flavipsychrobacter sp.]